MYMINIYLLIRRVCVENNVVSKLTQQFLSKKTILIINGHIQRRT